MPMSREHRATVSGLENAMRYYMTKFTGPSLYTAMNQLSNHDHSRFLTRTNHKVGRASALGVAAASREYQYTAL